MPRVLRRTNFTDPRAPAFCFCAAEFRLNQFISAARTKISDAPGQKMLLPLRAWQRRLSLWSAIVNRSWSAKEIYGINLGMNLTRRLRWWFYTEWMTCLL